MIKAFLSLRIKQILRGLTEIGIARALFVVGIVAFIAFTTFKQSAELSGSYYLLAVFLFIIVLFQLKRLDKDFLRIHITNFKWILWVEYLLIAIPILLGLLYHGQWISIFILILSISLIVHLDFQPRLLSLNTKVQQWIPADNFEWKGEVRKLFFFMITLWCTALITSFFIGSVPIAVFFIGMVPLSFIERNEPYQMLIATEMNTNKFLLYKTKRHLFLFTAMVAPLIVAFMIFHYENWYILIGEYIILIFLHIYLILAKYSFYEPNSKSPALQVFGAIGVLFVIVPIFLPVTWLLCLRFYYGSRKNLNFYLNDFN